MGKAYISGDTVGECLLGSVVPRNGSCFGSVSKRGTTSEPPRHWTNRVSSPPTYVSRCIGITRNESVPITLFPGTVPPHRSFSVYRTFSAEADDNGGVRNALTLFFSHEDSTEACATPAAHRQGPRSFSRCTVYPPPHRSICPWTTSVTPESRHRSEDAVASRGAISRRNRAGARTPSSAIAVPSKVRNLFYRPFFFSPQVGSCFSLIELVLLNRKTQQNIGRA